MCQMYSLGRMWDILKISWKVIALDHETIKSGVKQSSQLLVVSCTIHPDNFMKIRWAFIRDVAYIPGGRKIIPVPKGSTATSQKCFSFPCVVSHISSKFPENTVIRFFRNVLTDKLTNQQKIISRGKNESKYNNYQWNGCENVIPWR